MATDDTFAKHAIEHILAAIRHIQKVAEWTDPELEAHLIAAERAAAAIDRPRGRAKKGAENA
jgi:GAF domain-containing protein